LQRRVSAVISAGAAIVLSVLAVPHSMAALHALAADATLRRGLAGDALPEAAWRFIIESRVLALRWTASWGDGWLDMGFAEAKLAALPAADDAAKLEHWLASRAALLQGLARAPARPFAWARLSAIDLALGEPALAATALWLSVVTGPVERELILPRCRLALRLWDVIDERQKASISSQFGLALQHFPRHLVALLVGSGTASIVRHELADAPALLKRLDHLLAIHPS